MKIIIKELDKYNIEDVGKCDGQFVIDSQLMLQAENNQIRYTVHDRPVTKKQYDRSDIDYASYINNPDKAVFLAYINGTAAGQIALFKNWTLANLSQSPNAEP